MKRGFILFMVALLILFLGAVIVIYSSIGSIITVAVEEHGSQITQTKVTLNAADFTPSSGEGVLSGLKVGNPPGFKSEYALSFDTVSFRLDIASLSEPVIVIEELRIIAPEIIYEIGVGEDNLHRLKANIDRTGASSGSDSASKRIVIENLYIEKGALWVSARNLENGKQTAILADIHLTDIGKNKNGLPPSRLVQTVMAPLMQEVTLAALDTDLSLEDQAHNVLEGVREESAVAMEALKKQGNAALEALSREAAEALKNLDAESGKTIETVKRESSGFLDWLKGFLNSSKENQ